MLLLSVFWVFDTCLLLNDCVLKVIDTCLLLNGRVLKVIDTCLLQNDFAFKVANLLSLLVIAVLLLIYDQLFLFVAIPKLVGNLFQFTDLMLFLADISASLAVWSLSL